MVRPLRCATRPAVVVARGVEMGCIVFSPRPYSGLQKVSASGGVPTPATKLSQGDVAHIRPSFLPDGRHFLYRRCHRLSREGRFTWHHSIRPTGSCC